MTRRRVLLVLARSLVGLSAGGFRCNATKAAQSPEWGNCGLASLGADLLTAPVSGNPWGYATASRAVEVLPN
jgi:hypothetical protein